MSEERKQQIILALVDEVEQQAGEQRTAAPKLSEEGGLHRYTVDGDIDVLALATAVDAALGGDALDVDYVEDGIPPDQLNASNDD